jgi:methylthioribose-1-phosphate isomerase
MGPTPDAAHAASDQEAPVTASPFHTVAWLAEGAVSVLDQRRLPARVEYLRIADATAMATAIRTLAVRGAPAIGCAAAYGIAVEAHRLRAAPAEARHAGLQAAFEDLARSRPTAVNLFWALDRMGRRLAATPADGPGAAAALLDEAHAVLGDDRAANLRMGAAGAALVGDGARILTHCNAGALATAAHGTALGVIRSAVAAGKRVSVLADETRPVLQGARLTAWELLAEGIPVTLIPDGAAGLLMARGEVDLVIVGADRVAANGDVANKIGTYPLAVLARRHNLPFYVACPLSTVDLSVAHGSAIPIEERGADEVTGYGAERWAPPGVAVRNPAFDITPADLVSALITEAGVLRPPLAEALRAVMAGASAR